MPSCPFHRRRPGAGVQTPPHLCTATDCPNPPLGGGGSQSPVASASSHATRRHGGVPPGGPAPCVADPCGLDAPVGLYGGQGAAVETTAIRAEPFQAVKRRQVAGRVREGDQLAVDDIPVSGHHRHGQVALGEAGLRYGVRQRVIGARSEDRQLGNLQCREPGRQIVEAADDGGGPDVDGVAAEAVMVPLAALQGAVDEDDDVHGAVSSDNVACRWP